ncbi:MAG: ComEC/Rec2 family competence protein, partial [Capnocytophaga sp.]|nr:ComEC/Rec2 family competence protein [Capnocytophaga sp.]
MRFVNTAILTILLGIVIGITISDEIYVSIQNILIGSLGLLALLSVHLLISLKNTKFRKGFVFHTFVMSLTIGILVSFLHNPISKSNHYTKLLTENFYYLFKGEITEKISESDFGITYKVKLISADNQSVTGDVLCFFPSSIKNINDAKQSNLPFLRGQIIDFTGKCTPIPVPKNPYQFDYKKYMERKYVYWRSNVVSYSAEKKLQINSIRGFAEKIRLKMFVILDENFSKETAALLKTLLLGERSELDEEVYQYYIDAGAVHILAISGLHVGIVTAILLFFLQKIPNIGIWKHLRLILLLLFLWSFAFLAGLSPSVLRAVTMFSFVGIALVLNRQQGRFDALMFSMLLLLLIFPNYLYDVGFQLSYAAVFSILIFYPKIEKWYIPKNKFLKNVWSLLVIGFAAQIVFLPISLYYFHQFPTLFFISNLLIVPLLSPILILGFVALLLGFLGILPTFLVFILEKIIALMN